MLPAFSVMKGFAAHGMTFVTPLVVAQHLNLLNEAYPDLVRTVRAVLSIDHLTALLRARLPVQLLAAGLPERAGRHSDQDRGRSAAGADPPSCLIAAAEDAGTSFTICVKLLPASSSAVLDVFDEDGQERDDDDADRDEREVVLDDRDVAEEQPGAHAEHDPASRAGGVVEARTTPASSAPRPRRTARTSARSARTGRARRLCRRTARRTHARARGGRRLSSRCDQLGRVGRLKDPRADRAADRVVHGVARERGRRPAARSPPARSARRSPPARRPRTAASRPAGTASRRTRSPRRRCANSSAVDPRAVGADELEQVLVEMEDEVDERGHYLRRSGVEAGRAS